jgi:hypothetical protein
MVRLIIISCLYFPGIFLYSQISNKPYLNNNYAAAGTYAPYVDGNLLVVGYGGPVTFSTGVIKKDSLFAFPVYETVGTVITSIAVRYSSGAVVNVRAGIYSDSGLNRVPNLLIADFGTITIGNAINSLNYWNTPPLPFKFRYSGVYWFVLVFSGDVTVKTITVGKNSFLGYDDPHTLNCDVTQIQCLAAGFTYGPLPQSFSGIKHIVLSGGGIPAMFKTYKAQ